MTKQLSHNETSFEEKTFNIVLLLDHITGEANIGSLFRLADAFGVEKILFGGVRPNLKSNRLIRTSRNTHNRVDFDFFEDPGEALKNYKNKGYHLAGLEITSNSEPIQNISNASYKKIILVAGNERHGISSDILEACESIYHIEMFGENSSMNVAQSVGIALYELTKLFNRV